MGIVEAQGSMSKNLKLVSGPHATIPDPPVEDPGPKMLLHALQPCMQRQLRPVPGKIVEATTPAVRLSERELLPRSFGCQTRCSPYSNKAVTGSVRQHVAADVETNFQFVARHQSIESWHQCSGNCGEGSVRLRFIYRDSNLLIGSLDT